MASVVRLIHSKGGMAYLTVTMDTDASWTTQQAAVYIDQATTNAAHYPIYRPGNHQWRLRWRDYGLRGRRSHLSQYPAKVRHL